MAAEPQRAFSQTTLVVVDSDDAALPETPADLGAIGSRKTLVGGPNMDSVESDVFSSLSRCVPEHLPPLPPSLPACQRTLPGKRHFWSQRTGNRAVCS